MSNTDAVKATAAAGITTESTSSGSNTPYSSIRVGSSLSEVEETIARIKSHKNVEGVLIMNADGAIITSTLSDEESIENAALLSQLSMKASMMVNTMDPEDELTFLRIRSHKREVMIAPEKEYLMVVIQTVESSS